MTKTRKIGALIGCAMLALSAPLFAKEAAPAPGPEAAGNPAEAKPEAPAPKMSFGTWGVDLSQIDATIKPGNDFFAYVNSKWIAANPIPPEHARYGAFTMLSEKSQDDVRAMIAEMEKAKNAPGSAEARIVDAYRSYLDVKAIDAAGLAPARPYLDRIVAADSTAKLADLFGAVGYPAPLGGMVMVDEMQPDRYTVGFGADGLGLPDRDYYLKTDPKSQELQAKYREYLAFLLGKAGYADPASAAKAVYQLEYKFAQLGWDRTVLRDRDLTYNKVSRAELDQLAGNFPVGAMLAKMGMGEVKDFVVWQLPPTDEEKKKLPPETLAGIGGGVPAMFKLLGEAPPATLQAWTAAQFLMHHADVLPSDIDQANFAFFGKLLNGQQEQKPRWKRAIGTVEGELGELLGKQYVARHFPPDNKAAMDALVGNLRKAVAASLTDNGWMSAATKKEAEAKLDLFTTKIGYPERFKTYDGLAIRAGEPLANEIAAEEWGWNDQLSKLNGPIDRNEWFMLPQTVNAYYDPSKNEIVFPAGILQPPFFNASADPAVNYGGIGAVIGHEIGHGFDDQGAKSDGTGLMRDWWSPKDLAAFTAFGNKLAKQYDAYCPLDQGKTCVNGRFTLGENMGDLAGVNLAYRAYRMSLNGKEAPVIDGLTGDQRFFLSWAQVWRASNREDALRQRMMTDPHSPEEFRVNGIVRNMDAWYKAFDVKPGDKLYLPPEQRVHIW